MCPGKDQKLKKYIERALWHIPRNSVLKFKKYMISLHNWKSTCLETILESTDESKSSAEGCLSKRYLNLSENFSK